MVKLWLNQYHTMPGKFVFILFVGITSFCLSSAGELSGNDTENVNREDIHEYISHVEKLYGIARLESTTANVELPGNDTQYVDSSGNETEEYVDREDILENIEIHEGMESTTPIVEGELDRFLASP